MKQISEPLLEHKVLKSLAIFKTGVPHTGTVMAGVHTWSHTLALPVCSGALPQMPFLFLPWRHTAQLYMCI